MRGNFKFNNNDFPIQDLYVFEVAKDAKGRVSLKTIGVAAQGSQGRLPHAVHVEVTARECGAGDVNFDSGAVP